MVDDIGIDVVEAFLENFDIETYQVAVTLIWVVMRVALSLLQPIAEDCGEVPRGYVKLDRDRLESKLG